MSEWVVIPSWEKFQHYHDRRPVWIKDYPDQLDRDEYRALSPTARALLQDARRLCALSDGVVRRDTVAARVGMRLKRAHWKELTDAGFIELSASKPLALARARGEREKELEIETPKSPLKKKRENEKAKRRTRAWIDHTAHELGDVDLERVISDELGSDNQEAVADLVAYATERIRSL